MVEPPSRAAVAAHGLARGQSAPIAWQERSRRAPSRNWALSPVRQTFPSRPKQERRADYGVSIDGWPAPQETAHSLRRTESSCRDGRSHPSASECARSGVLAWVSRWRQDLGGGRWQRIGGLRLRTGLRPGDYPSVPGDPLIFEVVYCERAEDVQRFGARRWLLEYQQTAGEAGDPQRAAARSSLCAMGRRPLLSTGLVRLRCRPREAG